MFIRAKQGDILTEPVDLDDVKFVVGYEKEDGSPLFVILNHAGTIALSTPDDEDFDSFVNYAYIGKKEDNNETEKSRAGTIQ